MTALDASALRSYEDRLFDHCQQVWSMQTEQLGEEVTRQRVRGSIERAREFQITSESDVARFLDLTFVWGEDFARSVPWAAKILADEDRPPWLKIHQLSERTKRELSGIPPGASEDEE